LFWWSKFRSFRRWRRCPELQALPPPLWFPSFRQKLVNLSASVKITYRKKLTFVILLFPTKILLPRSKSIYKKGCKIF
jgi:hypothetical protein